MVFRADSLKFVVWVEAAVVTGIFGLGMEEVTVVRTGVEVSTDSSNGSKYVSSDASTNGLPLFVLNSTSSEDPSCTDRTDGVSKTSSNNGPTVEAL